MAARLHLEGLVKRRMGRDREFQLTIDRLELAPGAALALVGPNGCGKSTVIDLAGLATRPDSALGFTLEADGADQVDLWALWAAGRGDALAGLRARHFGYVPQVGALLPFLTVGANIRLPQALSGRRDERLILELAHRLGIDALLHEQPGRLSVGQRQRVAIARALAHAPDFVLADEPTASLDPEHAREVMRLLVELGSSPLRSLLVVSHDHDLLDAFDLPRLGFTHETLPRGWHTRLATPEEA